MAGRLSSDFRRSSFERRYDTSMSDRLSASLRELAGDSMLGELHVERADGVVLEVDILEGV